MGDPVWWKGDAPVLWKEPGTASPELNPDTQEKEIYMVNV